MKVGGGRSKIVLAVTIAIGTGFSALSAVDTGLTLTSPVSTNNTLSFVLNGGYGVQYIIETSTDLQTWKPQLTNDGPDYHRPLTIGTSGGNAFYRARMGNEAMFSAGMVAQSNITFSGSTITVDSFNSSNTNKFPGGQWNATNRSDNGNVASTFGTITVDDNQILGRVLTGLPDGPVVLRSKGSVGDLAWVTNSNTGIEPGRYVTNFPLTWPDVFPPYSSGITPTGSGTNTYVLDSANYMINGDLVMNAGDSLLVDSFQFAQLYVTGNVQMSAASSITIMPGAILDLYVGGTSATITQVNNPGRANAFACYGLPSNTSISIAPPSGAFTGVIYAPEANLTVNPSGSTAMEFQGDWVLNSIDVSGHVDFHVDETFVTAGTEVFY